MKSLLAAAVVFATGVSSALGQGVEAVPDVPPPTRANVGAAGGVEAPMLSPTDVPPPSLLPGTVLAEAQPIELFAKVKVSDRSDIHPCAKEVVVSVADPCLPGACRHVLVCMPPETLGEPKLKVNKDGTKVTFDFGEYEVRLVSKRDIVQVEYED